MSACSCSRLPEASKERSISLWQGGSLHPPDASSRQRQYLDRTVTTRMLSWAAALLTCRRCRPGLYEGGGCGFSQDSTGSAASPESICHPPINQKIPLWSLQLKGPRGSPS